MVHLVSSPIFSFRPGPDNQDFICSMIKELKTRGIDADKTQIINACISATFSQGGKKNISRLMTFILETKEISIDDPYKARHLGAAVLRQTDRIKKEIEPLPVGDI